MITIRELEVFLKKIKTINRTDEIKALIECYKSKEEKLICIGWDDDDIVELWYVFFYYTTIFFAFLVEIYSD